MDGLGERALNVLTSSKLLEALDISKEPDRVRERYGDGKPYQYQFDGAPTCNDHLLMARRLVEAGARVVTLSYGRWDSHGKNFDLVRDHGKKLDQCLSALIEDLDARGLLDDVTVIAWGEFGRTPRVNSGAGRDHWPQVSAAILAGGGIKAGQVIGHQPPRRVRHTAAGPFRRDRRHAVPQPRHQPRDDDDQRSDRPAAARRRAPGDARIDLTRTTSQPLAAWRPRQAASGCPFSPFACRRATPSFHLPACGTTGPLVARPRTPDNGGNVVRGVTGWARTTPSTA
jgi:hypothetical protein